MKILTKKIEDELKKTCEEWEKINEKIKQVNNNTPVYPSEEYFNLVFESNQLYGIKTCLKTVLKFIKEIENK